MLIERSAFRKGIMKIKIVILTALLTAFSLSVLAQSKTMNALTLESVSYAGELQVGKTESVILYVGMETGDYAAFCFTNNSKAGRAILAACKDREQCEFTGEITSGECKVPGLEADLSSSSKIVSVKSVKKIAANSSHAAMKTDSASNTAIAPNVIIKNLYAAQKGGSSPFFQTKDRALVDTYFTKEFADLIWKDAVDAKGEVGAFDFDPLYGSQDPQIKNFIIMETGWGGDAKFGADDKAVVQVTFKNHGKDEMVSFQFEQGADKAWKIYDIRYPNGDLLKGMLTNAAGTSQATSDIRKVDFLNYSYQASVCSEDAGLPRMVKVSNGKFMDREKNFFNVAKEEIAYGDVNGDGSEDAVILIRCGSAAGSLRAFEVHAYSYQNGKANLLARIDSPGVLSDYQKSNPDGMLHYAGEKGPKIVNGHVMVEALMDGSFAGPENDVTFDYQLSGDKFVLSGKPTIKKRQY